MRPAENTNVWRKGLRRHRHGNRPRMAAEDKTTLADIESRWMEQAAVTEELDHQYQSGERGGLDPDLELAAITSPNVTVILLPEPDA